jgi:hypothetical protein
VKEWGMENENIPDYLSSEYPEFLEYLPLKFENQEQEEYVSNIIETFNINFHHGRFESAFFNLHILYMISIYSTILKIKINNLEDFYISLINMDNSEIKKYTNKFKEGKFGLFDLSIFNENSVFLLLNSFRISDSDLSNLRKSVGKRNLYAHPRGRILIKDEKKLSELVRHNLFCLKIVEKKSYDLIKEIFLRFIKENFRTSLLEDFVLLDEIGKREDLLVNKEQIEKQLESKIIDLLAIGNYLSLRDLKICKNLDSTQIEQEIGKFYTKKLFDFLNKIFFNY